MHLPNQATARFTRWQQIAIDVAQLRKKPKSQLTENIRTMRIILTIIITILITACQSTTKPEEITSIVAELIVACAEDPKTNQACEKIPLDADLNAQVGEVGINEETAKVEWIWKWGISRSEKYELTISRDESDWHLSQIVIKESMHRVEEIIEIEPEVKIRIDKNLFIEASYVLQTGSNGKKLIIKEVSGVNEKTKTEKIVLSTITADPTDWVIVKGQLSSGKIKGDLTKLTRNYFKDYQAGNFAALEELAPDAANYNYQAELYIIDFEIAPPQEIKIVNADTGEPKRATIQGSPITEPFTLQAIVPVKVSYSLFGIEFTENSQLQLRKSKNEKRWTMPFWGVTKAVSLRQSVTLSGNTITLDGVGTTHDSTLIALTVSQDQPTSVAIKGYNNQNQLINSTQFPHAYQWTKELPKQEKMTITISSSNLIAKSDSAELTVNLGTQTALPVTSASGVQGRAEWGPTCGNMPLTDDSACENIPVETELTITDPSGLVVAQGKSSKDGFYRIGLPPGEYVLIPESSEFMPYNPVKFTVHPDELTYIPIIYPSMIP
ncbi:MAG: G5 domain-containing protein [Ardenticatenaceae bacterium]